MTNITYTFPVCDVIKDLRGVTVTGGVFCRLDGCDGEPDAVEFATKTAGGGQIIALIAGNPDLRAMLAAHQAEKTAVAP